MPKVKICGLTRPEDIEAVNTVKPDFVGFVFAPSRRQVTPEQAQALREKLDPNIKVVGVFVNQLVTNSYQLKNSAARNTHGMLNFQLALSDTIDIIQLHGQEDEDCIRQLKSQTDKPIIKAISVRHKNDVLQWQDTAADFLLLDNGPGGTGQTFDWSLTQYCTKPYFLAGGLSPENVTAALNATAPFAVDVSSGVETAGVKDPKKIMQFCKNATTHP